MRAVGIDLGGTNIKAGAVDAQGRILQVAVAVGSASPVAQRLPDLEAELRGFGGRPSAILTPRHLAGLAPIDDVRATAAYRLEAALSAVGEALDLAAGLS